MLHWLTEQKLKNLARHADPHPTFERSLGLRLKADMGHPMWWMQGWKWVTSSVLMVSLIGSGTGVYAYSSDDVLPEHPLYRVRQAIEQVEERTAVSPQKKAIVQLRRLKRRLQEQRLMKAKNRRVSKQLVQDFEERLDHVIETNGILPPVERDELDVTAGELKEQHEELVKQPSEDVEAIRAVIEKINKKIESLEETRRVNFERMHKERRNLENVRADKAEDDR
jgi:uncharacterized protein DUF5667